MGATQQGSPPVLPTLVALGVALALAIPLSLMLLFGSEPCGQGAAPQPSQAAQDGIPSNYLELYQGAGRRYDVPWTLLAAIGSVETNHGRLDAPGVRNGQNTHGCCAGPMQFHNNYGKGGGTWGRYGVDGNRDGTRDIYAPDDAIPSAARYLKASGAPGNLNSAIFAYNRAGWYVQKVLAKMRQYDQAGASALAAPAVAGGGCADMGGVAAGPAGEFQIAEGANAPGRPLTPKMRAFVGRMAGALEGPLIVTTGTNHSKYSSSGNVSDHYSGNGVDFGSSANGFPVTGGGRGDQIAAAAFIAAGLPRDEAITRARRGGSHTLQRNGTRIQIIWKSNVGGNHFNHVHAGLG